MIILQNPGYDLRAIAMLILVDWFGRTWVWLNDGSMLLPVAEWENGGAFGRPARSRR